ncbi:MAG: hypothetical protein IT285_04110 [Bdellovibrionales bacterium]|nr:hypothetical protein [Bdellovibrionales bacterium]
MTTRIHLLRRLAAFAGLALLPLVFASCNIFSFMDPPSGDEQILDKARACFDQGDIECAREYYGQLSDSKIDVQLSELAFVKVYEIGIGMADFMLAFGGGLDGSGLTVMANRLVGKVDSTTRQELYDAYDSILTIDDTALRGLARFVTASAFAAHILAENAGADEVFTSADLLSDSPNCTPVPGTCSNIAACAPLVANDLDDSGAVTDFDNGVIADPHLALFRGAVIAMDTGLDELDSGGSFDTGGGSLTQTLGAIDPTASLNDAACFRAEMVAQGIGQ